MIKTKYTKTSDSFPLHDIRVVDGDTVEARIILPFRQSVLKRIRLKGWWADETTGLWAESGAIAKQRLEDYLALRVVWLLCPGEREDKYGRLIGHLMHLERIVDPREVLGTYQLTEAMHKEHRDKNEFKRRTDAHLTKAGFPNITVNEIWPCPCGPEGTHQGLETCPYSK
jgi:hypothetical protein